MGKFCGNCGVQLEADSRFCTECGNPIAQTNFPKPTLTEQLVEISAIKCEFDCPRCGNTHTQKISSILTEGRTTSSMTGTTTHATGYGGYLEGSVELEGESISGLASKFLQDRPSGSSFLSAAMVCVFFFLVATFYVILSFLPLPKDGGFALGLVVFFIIIGASCSITISLPTFKEELGRERAAQVIYERWMDTGFFCRRCTHVFIPGYNDEYPHQK